MNRKKYYRVKIQCFFLILCSVFVFVLFYLSNYNSSGTPRYSSDENLDLLEGQDAHLSNANDWFIVSGESNPLYQIAVYSAHYNPLNPSVITLLLLSNPDLVPERADFVCAFYDETMKLLNVAQATFQTEYLLNCRFHADIIPTYVTLLKKDDGTSEYASKNSWKVRIQNNYEVWKSKSKEDLAVCTKILYGNPNLMLLIQFFEHYKQQGVSKIYMKIRNSDFEAGSEILKILQYYEKDEALLETIPWDIDYSFCPPEDKWCHVAQHNECIFRTAYRYRYVFVCDYDELLLASDPDLKLTDFVRSLDYAKDIGSFIFRAEYHVTPTDHLPRPSWEQAVEAYRDGNLKEFLNDNLPLESWNLVSEKFAPHSYSPKTLVRPETVKQMWVHYVAEHHLGFEETAMNPSKQGYFLHFKNASAWPHITETYRFTEYAIARTSVTTDPRLLRLKTNIKTALRKLVLKYDD